MADNNWVDNYFAAVDKQDWTTTSMHLAANVVIEAPGFSGTGPEAVNGWMAAFFVAFPDLSHNPTGVTGDTSRLAVEVRVTGSHTGDLASAAGTVPPTGRSIDLWLGEFWDLDSDGKIVRYRVYFDQLEFLTQLGLAG